MQNFGRLSHSTLLLVWSATGLTLTGCGEQRARAKFIEQVESAHGAVTWPAGQALVCDIDAQLGLNAPVQARLTCDWNSPRATAVLKDGTRVVFDGFDVWVAPESANPAFARELVMTWPWLLMAPVKLRSPYVQLLALGDLPYTGAPRPALRAQRYSHRREAGYDGYILYADPQTGQLSAQAYVAQGAAAANPDAPEAQAVTYADPVQLGSVTLATRWEFWPWRKGAGPCGDYIGFAQISNLSFAPADDALFAIPAAARRLPHADRITDP